jgi:outer membrane putative beta-barrel porin/alpha-amylase
MRIHLLAFCLIAATSVRARSQIADSAKIETPVIQDNSFLVEEAYNQDAGVVQHITTYQVQRGTPGFQASFTQEWPVGSIKHQLSYGIPLSRANSETGIGDLGLNYRYQAVGDGEAKLAISPRLSVTVPTGDWKKSRGSGGAGLSAAIPVSYVVNPLLVTHFDIGAGVIPSARDAEGDHSRILDWTTAASAIITASNRIQPMLEAVYLRGQAVVGRNRTERSESVLISPGVRGAFNFRSGLQIVPGVAVPIGIGTSKGQRYAFFYLSFEHPFNEEGRPKS